MKPVIALLLLEFGSVLPQIEMKRRSDIGLRFNQAESGHIIFGLIAFLLCLYLIFSFLLVSWLVTSFQGRTRERRTDLYFCFRGTMVENEIRHLG